MHRQAQTLALNLFKWSSALPDGDYCQTIYPTLYLEQCFNLAGTQNSPFCSREAAQLLTCVSDHKGCSLRLLQLYPITANPVVHAIIKHPPFPGDPQRTGARLSARDTAWRRAVHLKIWPFWKSWEKTFVLLRLWRVGNLMILIHSTACEDSWSSVPPLLLNAYAGERSCLVHKTICVGPWFSSSASCLEEHIIVWALHIWSLGGEKWDLVSAVTDLSHLYSGTIGAG